MSIKNKIDITPFVGYQQANLKWSIAGNVKGENPNVLSELTWERLRGLSTGIDLKYDFSNSFSLKLNTSFFKIMAGKVNDTDYASDHRQDISYDENFDAGKGYDVSLLPSLSYLIYSKSKFKINTFLGYTFRAQKLYLYDLEFVLDRVPLNSSYRTNWKGLSFGTDLTYHLKKFDVNLEVAWAVLKYNARANWNLIPQFAQPVSFTHKANAFFVQTRLKIFYRITENIKIALLTNINYSQSFEGTDQAYYKNQNTLQTLFNGSKSTLYGINLGFNYSF